MIEVKLHYSVHVHCHWHRILYKNWFLLYNARLSSPSGKIQIFMCCLIYYNYIGRIHIKASFNSKKKIQGNGDKFPHTIGQRMLLTPWCFYFWQINGRIWEEPEADGGDEHQP